MRKMSLPELEFYVGWGGGFTKKCGPDFTAREYLYEKDRLSQFGRLIADKEDCKRLSPTVAELRRTYVGSRGIERLKYTLYNKSER